ncbi:MAG TPA: diacylglycerol kinase family protein [Gemmatimonadales bacterium]|nr:diacylglycerol kinase family protein [Gemmatimonadales bacterium]
MRATLLHNKDAGRAGSAPSKKELLKLLEGAGYKVSYQSTRKPGVEQALEDPGDLLVIAGGDRTVGKVLRRLERRDVPLALIPLGTANNIATALGVTGTPEAILTRLADARRRRLDLGIARTAGGERRFVESAGLGLLAEFLKHSAESDDPASRQERLQFGLKLLQHLATRVRSRLCRVRADDQDFSGRYLLAVACNIGSVGPRLPLAPQAEPGDGKLDLLLVGESRRAALKQYLGRLARGEEPEFPFSVLRASRIRMGWAVGAGHVDDRVWPSGPVARQGTVTLEVGGGPFEVLVP